MNIQDIKVGGRYTYRPSKQGSNDNRHESVVVEAIGRRIKVRDAEGNLRHVSAAYLTDQSELELA